VPAAPPPPAEAQPGAPATPAPASVKPSPVTQPEASPLKTAAPATQPEASAVEPAAPVPPPAPEGLPSLATVFGASFMRWALLAGLIVTGVCGYVGVYVVLKRIVFVGVALAEVSSAGVALALLTGINPFLGAVVLMFAGIGLFSVRWAPRKVSQEAFIGVGWAVASALGVLLIAKSAQGEAHMHDLLFGNILTVDGPTVWLTTLGLAVVLIIHALFAKEFQFISFDADTAAAMGYRARTWDLLLYATIGLSIAFSIHTVGVLLAFSALVLPPVTALLLTSRMKSALAASVVLSLIPVPIGLYLSFVGDLPSSATIVAVMFVLLMAGGLVSRLRAAR
jgi:zinc transport system permease protein